MEKEFALNGKQQNALVVSEDEPNGKKVAQTHKNKMTNFALLLTYALNNCITVFVTTFLVSYLYTISDNYVVNIGLFYASHYFFMGIFYLLVSKIIDKTNRISCYRIAIIIRFIFILVVIFAGKDIAKFVVLAGILQGFSDAFYWTSYNIMKNELVSKSRMKNYSGTQHVVEKLASILVPITLGKIIDVESFKVSAIIVLIIAIIEMIASLLITSKRPENSSFDYKGYKQKLNALGEKKKVVTFGYYVAICYGFIAITSQLNTILIMFTFNSNFSLGMIVSIVSTCAMIVLFFLSRFTKPGKRTAIFPVAGTIPLVCAILLVIVPSKVTAIMFNASLTICSTVHSFTFDVARNLVIKRLGLYDEIAEYQATIDIILEISRTVSYLIMVVAGLIFANVGTGSLIVATKVLLVMFVLAILACDIMMMIYEKLLKKNDIYIE